MRNLLLTLCFILMSSCFRPKPIETYTSSLVWFAKFKDSHGASDPFKQVANSKGLFVIKRFKTRFEVVNANTLFDLMIDSSKSFSNSTRFYLKNQNGKLFQLSIYADSAQLLRKTASIEFTSWSKPYYVRFMDWNPKYVYHMDAVKR